MTFIATHTLVSTSAENILTGMVGMLLGMGLTPAQVRTAFQQVSASDALWETFEVYADKAHDLAVEALIEVTAREPVQTPENAPS